MLSAARSLLFVSGNRPDRFAKAASSGADAVVIDLEDAVAPADKNQARTEVDAWLRTGARAVVRINGSETDWHRADVEMVSRYQCPVMVPKAQSASQLESVADLLGPDAAIVALVESSAGVMAAAELCAVGAVTRAAFGSIDLAAELGVDPDSHEALAHARSALVLASAAAGCPPPLDGVTTAVGDDDALAADIAHAARLGYGGKLCVHPQQVNAVNASFTPAAHDIDWARRIVDASGTGSACLVDGRMVDKPVVDRARRLLERVELFDGDEALTG